MALDNFKSRIDKLDAFDFKQEFVTVIEANTGPIEEFQKDQLYAGKDRHGREIALEGEGYAWVTIQIKKEKGQPYDRVTWNDTGELYASLTTEVKGDRIDTTSNNFKYEEMIKRSGPEVIGLNPFFGKEFAEEYTLPGINKALKAKTGISIKGQ